MSVAVLLSVLRRSEARLPESRVSTEFLRTAEALSRVRSRGSPAAADTVVEVTDFLCPACAIAQQGLAPFLDSLVAEGLVVHRVIELPIQMGSGVATVAGECVWRSAPSEYWRWRVVLYDAQRSIAAAYPVADELVRLAGIAGIDSSRLRTCIVEKSSTVLAESDSLLISARRSPIAYTPVLALNGDVVPYSLLTNRLRETVAKRK